jgi:hypothetical protein
MRPSLCFAMMDGWSNLPLTSSAPQAARIPTEPRWLYEVSSVGSSHNRPTSPEDNEEA